jgi:hypothetical protein
MFLLLNLIHFGVVIFPLAIVFSHSPNNEEEKIKKE